MKQIRHILSVLMIILIVVLATGTVVERLHGSTFALSHVYGTWWFVGLWALVAILMVWIAVKTKMWKRFTVFVMHLAILLILVGALLTKLTGMHGEITLKPGVTMRGELPFTLTLDRFEVVPYPGTHKPMDFVSHVIIDAGSEGEEKAAISMNHILKRQHYRFYQTDYDAKGNSTLSVARDPWGIGITYTGYVLLFLALVAMLVVHGKTAPKAITVSWLAVLIVLMVLLHIRMLTHQLMPVLRSPLFSLHISTIVTAYALLLAIMVVGIVAMIKAKDLARLEKLKTLSMSMLYPAVALLTIGIFVGAVWANISWGNYWSWDPKEVWALITLLIYAAPLHGSIWKLFQKPRIFHYYCIFAFLSVVITYFGVNLILGGVHAYN
ncbi:MAG: cytochrome c biogenesis protein CcsA [Bacteroidales bacterium]|nr:cytochrome c biogenesis protein CcsA [Bacteroidales bacterium]